MEVQKEVYPCFIDYTKVFHGVRHNGIITQLKIYDTDLRRIKNIHWEQTATFRVDAGIISYKKIKCAVLQRCALSPYLFSIYDELIMRNLI